jgi:hypothetical protein
VHPGAAEEDVALALVGPAGDQQCGGQLQHMRHVGTSPRHHRRPVDPQGLHVALEQEFLAERELVVVLAAGLRRAGEHVVDVGDVAADLHLDAGRGQHAAQGVGPDEGGRVAQVRDVVGRDAAGVDPRGAQDRQRATGQPQVGAAQRARFAHPAGGAENSGGRHGHMGHAEHPAR